MKPLICPQCGGKIINYLVEKNFATCGYCGTKFVIEPAKQNQAEKPKSAPYVDPAFEFSESSKPNPNVFISVIVTVCLVIGGAIFMGVLISKSKPKTDPPGYGTKYYPTPIPDLSPKPTINPNLLEFGGSGTSNGLFKDAKEIAVDSKGKIYVADETMRVQQFNEKGEFLKVWQIPSQTVNYKHARSIDKIAVSDAGKLYVAVGGVVQIYDDTSSEAIHTIHAAPDYIQDFALRKDGTLLLISNNDEIETLIYVNSARKVTRRINGFHTDTADAALSPAETGLAAIRMAVDGAGNIFSIYAFGDLGNYELSYNVEDLMILRFTPEGKYVNKFVQTMNSCGIAVDNQSRIYISNGGSIDVYSNTGSQISTVFGLDGINSFALDSKNYVYYVSNNKVFKRPSV